MNKYSISEFCKITGLSEYTLRYYEKIGLIGAVERDKGGKRIYTDYEKDYINFVLCLKSTGMPIERIKKYVEYIQTGDETVEERKEMLEEHLENIKEQIAELHRTCDTLEHKIKWYKEVGKELRKNK